MSNNSKKKREQKPQDTATEALSTTRNSIEKHVETSMKKLESLVGGRQALIEGLIATGHPLAKKFVAELGKSENGHLNLYEVCQKVQSSPEQLLSIFQKGELVRGAVQSFVKLAEGLPAVMEESLRIAQHGGVDGFKDRELLFRMSGMDPKTTGVQVNLNQQFNMSEEGTFEKMVGATTVNENPFDVDITDVS